MMPVSAVCGGCNKTLRGNDSYAGRTIRCPNCKTSVTLPQLEVPELTVVPEPVVQAPPVVMAEEDEDDFRLMPAEAIIAPPIPHMPTVRAQLSDASVMGMVDSRSGYVSISNESLRWQDVMPGVTFHTGDELPAPPDAEPCVWLHLCWVFAVALLPLFFTLVIASFQSDSTETAISLLSPEEQELLKKTIEAEERGEEIPDEVKERLITSLRSLQSRHAFLPRDTMMHWFMAMMAAALFLGVISSMGLDGSARPVHLLAMGLVASTLGVFFLLVIHVLADWSNGLPIVRGGGIISAAILIFKFIGYSYYAAQDPNSSFLLSFLGYVCGVGLCEELAKVFPVYVFYRAGGKLSSRGAMLWGLALGAGFGIAEGILYSAEHYNGRSGVDIYFVRFLSCVSLHAMWTSTAAMMISLKLDLGLDGDDWLAWLKAFAYTMGAPILLHGLYDVCLEKEQIALALLTALVSGALFIWMTYYGKTTLERALQIES